MASESLQGAELRLRRLTHWLDPESAAVVTILLGLFQLLLLPSFAFTTLSPPKLFIVSLILGILIVAGGSLTIANERMPNRRLLQGCACSNVVSLLVALLALCLYSYNLSTLSQPYHCYPPFDDDYYYFHSYQHCPPESLRASSLSVTLLLLLCDAGAVITHSLLSISAFRTLNPQ